MKVYMKYSKDCGYMSIVETISDVENAFLSRREIVCNFKGLGGSLKRMTAVDMITKQFNLGDKFVVPMRLQCEVGKVSVRGTFYVYDKEDLAKKHISPIIFTRLEKAKKAEAEALEKENNETEKTE